MTEYDVEDSPGTLVGFEKPASRFTHYADPDPFITPDPDPEPEPTPEPDPGYPKTGPMTSNPAPVTWKPGMDCSCGTEFKDKNPKRIKGFEYEVEDDPITLPI